MFAQSRIARLSGRIRKVENNSMGATMRYSALGTPGGNSEFLR